MEPPARLTEAEMRPWLALREFVIADLSKPDPASMARAAEHLLQVMEGQPG